MGILRKVYLLIYIFIFLFAPPFLSEINILIPLSIYSLLVIIFKYRKNAKKLFLQKEFRKIVLIILLYFITYIFTTLINTFNSVELYPNNYILNIYSFILNFPLTIICALYLVFKFDHDGLSFNDMIRYFIYAGFIQFLLALSALIIPNARNWMLSHMLKANNSRLLSTPWIISRRFYGFSNSMLDLFGFGTGIIAVLPLYYASVNNKKAYTFLIPFLLVVPMLNSRTGLVIAIIGIIVYILGKIHYKKINMFRFIRNIMIIVVLAVLTINIVNIYSPNTINWIKNDFVSFWDNNTYGTADILFNKSWWKLPDVKYMLLGTGYSTTGGYSNYLSNFGFNSDVGYINEIWRTGIIGSCIIYYYLFKITVVARKCVHNLDYKILFLYFLIASLVMLVKGYVFSYNPGNVIFYTLVIMSIYESSGVDEKI